MKGESFSRTEREVGGGGGVWGGGGGGVGGGGAEDTSSLTDQRSNVCLLH